jgi:thiol-disulfide isomerase/thioredoxin
MTRRNLHRRNWPVGGAASIISGLALSLLLGWPVAAAPEELAPVDGVAITAEEVDWALGAQLTTLHEQLYNLRRQKVEALVAEKLLAKEAEGRGLSVPTLLDTEVTSKVGLVTEQEIETFYQANKTRLQGDEATLREQIRAHLQNQKLTAQREAFVQSLRAQTTVVIHLEPPPPLRVQIAVDGAPFKGSAAAPVTIVEFTDFQCPFCKRVQTTLEQVQSRYGEQVKVVHRDFRRLARRTRLPGVPTRRGSSGPTMTCSTPTRPRRVRNSSRPTRRTWGWILRPSSNVSTAANTRPPCSRT